MAYSEIPILDLNQYGDEKTRPQLIETLRRALTEIGFLYVVNHGVPSQAINDIMAVLPRLFSLPEAAKDEIALVNSPHFLGYSGDEAETTAGQPDRREQVEFATELTETWHQGVPLRERLRGPNPWPTAYPELRPVVETYIRELTLLGERFLRVVAEAVSLPADTFLPFLSDQHRLKLVRYPPIAAAEGGAAGADGLAQGVGPHKDSSGWWTFLLQASPDVGGLQVLNRAGAWVDVPPLPGSFVVNIGQAFEVVTNGVCPATTHRVVLKEGAPERFSVPFFQGVRRGLTKAEAVGTLKAHFDKWYTSDSYGSSQQESSEARAIDSAFLKGRYDTWGESQLRTKIRSHRDVGAKFYGEVFDKYVNDDI